MSIIVARELMCDECSYWIRLDLGGVTDAWPMLKKEGWTRSHGKHYCPACSKERKTGE